MGPKWTPEEIKRLRANWTVVGRRSFKKHLPRRTWTAVKAQAKRMGLPPLRFQPGMYAMRPLAQELGYAYPYLTKLLRWAGVQGHSAHTRSCEKLYDLDEAREAVLRWESLEGVRHASRRLKYHLWSLYKLVAQAGHRAPEGLTLRLEPRVYDELVAANRPPEKVQAHTLIASLGVSRCLLYKALRRFPPPNSKALVGNRWLVTEQECRVALDELAKVCPPRPALRKPRRRCVSVPARCVVVKRKRTSMRGVCSASGTARRSIAPSYCPSPSLRLGTLSAPCVTSTKCEPRSTRAVTKRLTYTR